MALYINGNKTGGGGGGNSNMRELTQAEYDALTTEEKNNGTVYYITDGDDSNGGYQLIQPIIYSEEEREVGVWTDGKPLYQKTILFMTNNNSGWTDVPHEINNIDEIINIQGIIDGYTAGTNAQGGIAFFGNDTNVSAFTNTSSLYNKLVKLTIHYTKTTDVAGSGKWTPQGTPAVHYSTKEQVVGTWIDGSTLYEKTVVASISEINSHEYSDNDLNNSDMAMIINGYYTLTNNFIKVPLNQWESSTYYTRTGFRDDKTIYLYVNGYSVTGNAYITIQYTKTTT